jgi:hypothetical protein
MQAVSNKKGTINMQLSPRKQEVSACHWAALPKLTQQTSAIYYKNIKLPFTSNTSCLHIAVGSIWCSLNERMIEPPRTGVSKLPHVSAAPKQSV